MRLMAKPAKKGTSAAPSRYERLTEPEYRMLKLLDLGFSNKEIAQKLGITVGTAKWHLHHLYEKLQVPSRGKALALARERGLV
jgi:LuxR family maltose regulon positive regulatory protein